MKCPQATKLYRRFKHYGKFSIVAAWAEAYGGPGWANSPVVVVIRDGKGKLHQEWIQPEDMTNTMSNLYSCSLAASASMRHAVEIAING